MERGNHHELQQIYKTRRWKRIHSFGARNPPSAQVTVCREIMAPLLVNVELMEFIKDTFEGQSVESIQRWIDAMSEILDWFLPEEVQGEGKRAENGNCADDKSAVTLTDKIKEWINVAGIASILLSALQKKNQTGKRKTVESSGVIESKVEVKLDNPITEESIPNPDSQAATSGERSSNNPSGKKVSKHSRKGPMIFLISNPSDGGEKTSKRPRKEPTRSVRGNKVSKQPRKKRTPAVKTA